MLTFNNNHIFTGYLKQLLASYPLTKYRVCDQTRPETWIRSMGAASADGTKFSFPQSDVYYIREGTIQKYQAGEGDVATWKNISPNRFGSGSIQTDHYQWNELTQDLNHATTLHSTSLIYDFHTHKYLGNFLRFLRDYHKLNLMPLYNCFTDHLISDVLVQVKNSAGQIISTFDASDERYKIYAIPVKLFQKYTIAIQCAAKVQCCCTIYNERTKSISRSYSQSLGGLSWSWGQWVVNQLANLTYTQFANAHFDQPRLYKKLQAAHLRNLSRTETLDTLPQNSHNAETLKNWRINGTGNRQLGLLASMQDDLCLLLKVPATLKSSIAVLQGDYTSFSDIVLQNIVEKNPATSASQTNEVVGGNQAGGAADSEGGNQANGAVKRKLVLDQNHMQLNCEGVDKIPALPLTTHLQLLSLNTGTSYPFANRLMQYLLGNTITHLQTIGDNIRRVRLAMAWPKLPNKTYSGLWSQDLQAALYTWATHEHGPDARLHENFGFVDKDVEALYKRTLVQKPSESIQNSTILDANLYASDYSVTGR